MLCCLPCLCVVACSKIFTTLAERSHFGGLKSRREREEKQADGAIGPDAAISSKFEDNQSS
jgi:hypothetical protein